MSSTKLQVQIGEERKSKAQYIMYFNSQWTGILWFNGAKQCKKHRNVCFNESDLQAVRENSLILIHQFLAARETS